MDGSFSPPGVAPPPMYPPASTFDPPIGAPPSHPPMQKDPPFANFDPPVASQLPLVYGPTSEAVICPSCRSAITTNVQHEASCTTHRNAILLCLIGCCCIPYLMDSCKSANHYCSNCGALLGSYN